MARRITVTSARSGYGATRDRDGAEGAEDGRAMKTLQLIALTLILVTPAAATADDTQAARAKAGEETREALSAYRKALEKELRELEAWVSAQAPPGGERLRDERALAKKKLEEIAEEAKRTWESARERMDGVIDDLKRRHGTARTER